VSRYTIFQGWSADGNGKIIQSATVTITLADTSTPPTALYEAKTGGSAITTGVITTDSTGFGVAYLDDADYPIGTEVDITISKANFTTTYLYDVRG
jgi:hypothetical protein